MNSKSNGKQDENEETIFNYETFRRALHSRGKLLSGLQTARKKLAPASIAGIVGETASRSIYRNVVVRNPFPKTIQQLKQKRPLPTASDRVEASWTASILALFVPEINEFIVLRDQYYSTLASSRYVDALAVLDQIQNRHGFSLWLISSKLAALQTYEGTSAQKRFLQELISVKGISGPTAYLAYLFGFTADENVSLAEVKREWSRQETFNLPQDAIEYYRYQISAFDYSSVDHPWQCVSLEENSSIIDRFETFVEMSSLAYIRASSPEDVEYIHTALKQLSAVSDRRVQNLLTVFDGSFVRETGLDLIRPGIDAMISSDLPGASKALLAAITEHPTEFSLHEAAAKIGVISNNPIRLAQDFGFQNQLLKQLEDVLSLNESYHESRFALQKLALIYRRSPISRSIVSFLDKEGDRIISSSSTENEALWALASPLSDPEQLPIFKQLNDKTMEAVATKISNQSIFFGITKSVVYPSIESASHLENADLCETSRAAFRGHLAFNRGKFADAISFYESYREGAKGYEKLRAVRLIYAAARANDDLSLALQVLTSAYLTDYRSYLVFPLEEVAVWAKENTGLDESCLNRSIALHIYLQHVSPKYDGDLSDAFEDVLEYYGVLAPSELLDNVVAPEMNRQRWIYFLREVATIRRLEDGTQLNNYEEIEAERLKVLTGLIERCPELSGMLSDEIVSLTQEREVAQLTDQFDRSRIYVNELGVKQSIEVELSDIVARYRRLIDSPDLQAEMVHIESILRKILKSSGQEFSTVILPATEEEDLLYALYGLVGDAFIFNPDHGLKTYLTTRILHGSLEGELRSSFTRQNLLFPSPSDADFDAVWRSRLRLSHSDYVAVRAAVNRFSRRVGDAIKELKDKRIRIVSKDTPNGIFDFTPNVRDVVELRAQVQSVTESEEFADKIIHHLWRKVDDALVKVKREIEGGFRRRILLAAENLRANLATVAKGADTSRIEDAITMSLTDFQNSLERVLAWFRRAGTAAVKPFAVETAVQVAARLTNSRFPSDPIAPEILSDGPLSIRGTAFSGLLDILRNCFRNAVEHGAEKGRAPRTQVYCQAVQGGFKFCVANALPSDHDPVRIMKAVSDALSEKRSSSLTRSGRGTGFREIERVLSHEGLPGTKLEIDMRNNQFVVAFAIRA
ncbi:hypothetical protein JQ609_18700 [Bradyrhizobium sp. AUGA SZCCT0169]|uniref:hypothetical protein n=1 Tax=Bradyrhizobium sp. AUGA SZCCT0169 TaxID=2807663 RepID=UPI001BA5080E|nr:hypothetical protein [Bradyrhizobium sp. AUGA SZCCT0169]MBR1248951.1 hypothetical protein [Bradyrhizobium sp. AUGA SZCCT0169]